MKPLDIYQLSYRERTKARAHKEEDNFFLSSSYLLGACASWAPYLKPKNSFDVIRANILIRAFLNKKTLEKSYSLKTKTLLEKKHLNSLSLEEFMLDVRAELPHFDYQGKTIYVPFFPLSINEIYSYHLERLDEKPYHNLLNDFESVMVDPFDYYGYKLFASPFCHLVMLHKEKDGAAFYDYDQEALYFVNEQGRLDGALYLFDRFLLNPKKSRIVPRLETVLEAYYANNQELFYERLLVEGFFSYHFLSLLKKARLSLQEKSEKIQAKDEKKDQ